MNDHNKPSYEELEQRIKQLEADLESVVTQLAATIATLEAVHILGRTSQEVPS